MNRDFSKEHIEQIISEFGLSNFKGFSTIGEGLINDSFVIHEGDKKYILQRLNNSVFKNLRGIERNYAKLKMHLDVKKPFFFNQIPNFIQCSRDNYLFQDSEEGNWRLMEFIEHDVSKNLLKSEKMSFSIGKAMSEFHAILKDLPATEFEDPIPEFHNTSKRIEAFEHISNVDPLGRLDLIKKDFDFLQSEKDFVLNLQNSIELNLPKRLVHQDTKLSNFLFDENDEVKAIIDLDTLGPGYLYYDFGDFVRSSMSESSEDSETDSIHLNWKYLNAFVEGYFDYPKHYKESEIESFCCASLILTFEQAIRFAEDFLKGDIYFKVTRKDQNLLRLRNQIAFYKIQKNELHSFKYLIDQNSKS